MKKQWLILLVCLLIGISWNISAVLASESRQENCLLSEYTVAINGESLGDEALLYQDTYYIPMRKVFEGLGASVFYRDRDATVLALSRDGDVISHIVGDVTITVNGKQQTFLYPSVLFGGQAYIPLEMLSVSFCPDSVIYDNGQLNIRKYMFHNDVHIRIQDVLEMSDESNFYPERFGRYLTFHTNNPSCSMQEVLYRVNLGLDYPFYENVTTITKPYELLVLVNKYNRLPEDFSPANLVSMNSRYASGSYHQLRDVAYDAFVQMADAAREDGITLRVVSSYRTESTQRATYNNKVRSTGKVNADNYSAKPGHSEHQTGLAVDIGSTRFSFEYSNESKWLQQHAHEYGYILRYPKGKEWITGYSYEAWHYRFVGVEAATIIYNEDITYEEYYAKYVSVNEFK